MSANDVSLSTLPTAPPTKAPMPDLSAEGLEDLDLEVEQTTALVLDERVEVQASTTQLQKLVKYVKRCPDSMVLGDDLMLSSPEPGTLRLTAMASGQNGLDVGWLRYDGDAQTRGSALPAGERVVVDRKPFIRLIQDLPEGKVVRLTKRRSTIEVKCESSTYEIEQHDADVFPETETDVVDDSSSCGFFDVKATKGTFAWVRKHLSDDSLRPAMTTARVGTYKGKKVLVGTDGYSLSVAPYDGTAPDGLKLPQSAFDAVRGMHGDAVTIRSQMVGDRRRYTLECGPERFSWSEAQESYPDWRNILPDVDTGTWTVYDVEAMKEALERIKPFTKDTNNQLELHLSPGAVPKIKASAEFKGNEGTEELPFSEYSGPGARIGFNVDYLLRLFQPWITDAPVRLRHGEPSANGTMKRALVARDRVGRMALVMPVLLNGNW